ncbi:formyl transferase [Paucihalobacter ruber]|uniref:Formyl transferase n=1 Tax=Paucihalobacter ruber TaxID=2567861 RepID=A0A506PQV0_9FLAO|nr:formyltransferase family protein [Paucihalobacter ruber]TPV35979.1 formyl transferase [Paucihalobacter ruber]
MRIVIITQNEPFYLIDSLNYLIDILPKHSQIVGCVVNDVSPFGKKETFFEKAKKTLHVFGFAFFMHYGFKFVKNKFDKSKNIKRFLSVNSISEISLDKHINHQDSIEKIKSFKPDLLISILGNQIFKNQIINLAPKGCLNLHTALLPKYRGLMPTFWVLKNNEKFTGVSVFQVDEGIDSGPIVVQEKVEIGNRSQEELIVHTKKIGMEAIAKAVDLIYKDKVVLINNDASQKTYYSFPTRSDVKEFLTNGKRFY